MLGQLEQSEIIKRSFRKYIDRYGICSYIRILLPDIEKIGMGVDAVYSNNSWKKLVKYLKRWIK